MGITLLDIFTGMAAWEQSILPAAPIERADHFQAFATFPTPEDIDLENGGSLAYPFSAHWCETSDYREVSVTSVDGVPGTGWVEDEAVHVIIAALIFGRDGDPLHLLSRRDAGWRDAYRDGFLLNLHVGLDLLGAQGSSITAIMGKQGPISFDFVNSDNVGIQTPITVTLRQRKPVSIHLV